LKNKYLWITLVILALPALWCSWKLLSISQENIEFKSGNLVIRGTLVSPRFSKSLPAVVLVHGSGPTSRKSTILYAWIFASQGYAALSYDKRGVGKSDGGENEWQEFILDDLAADAAEGYRFLQSRSNIDSEHIGFFGASQGGWVVSIAASHVESPAFLIMASVSFSTIAEDRLHGREAQTRHEGFGEDAINQAIELLKLDHQVTRTGKEYEKLMAAFGQYHDSAWLKSIYPNLQPLPVDDVHREWERKILDFDPQPYLKKIKAPVLWIFGDPELDRFSPVNLSISRVKQAQTSGMPYKIIQIDKVSHTLKIDGSSEFRSFVQIKIPLLWKLFHWLDEQMKSLSSH
jgi:pimeloyl-ACP methyl ester carboxylesterase